MTPQHWLWPSNVSAVAAAGDVIVQGGFTMFPSATGTPRAAGREQRLSGPGPGLQRHRLHLQEPGRLQLADRNLDPADEPERPGPGAQSAAADLADRRTNSPGVSADIWVNAGMGETVYSYLPFSEVNPPDLHAGDHEPIRIYAGEGDIFMNRRGRGVTRGHQLPRNRPGSSPARTSTSPTSSPSTTRARTCRSTARAAASTSPTPRPSRPAIPAGWRSRRAATSGSRRRAGRPDRPHQTVPEPVRHRGPALASGRGRRRHRHLGRLQPAPVL